MTNCVLSEIPTLTSITIEGMVTINTQTSEITYHEGYTPDEAAKTFWEAIGRFA